MQFDYYNRINKVKKYCNFNLKLLNAEFFIKMQGFILLCKLLRSSRGEKITFWEKYLKRGWFFFPRKRFKKIQATFSLLSMIFASVHLEGGKKSEQAHVQTCYSYNLRLNKHYKYQSFNDIENKLAFICKFDVNSTIFKISKNKNYCSAHPNMLINW